MCASLQKIGRETSMIKFSKSQKLTVTDSLSILGGETQITSVDASSPTRVMQVLAYCPSSVFTGLASNPAFLLQNVPRHNSNHEAEPFFVLYTKETPIQNKLTAGRALVSTTVIPMVVEPWQRGLIAPLLTQRSLQRGANFSAQINSTMDK